ncbi:NACHT domain-containing protein [Madurella fahalii]|uniref:NACHT domain-containing protein n=1 Tax=Madurella fahalii TaxID=1157608 RepID=A0ABQ0GSS7_9PEZI
MDGLSAAASVIAVVQLLDRIVTLCYQYGKAVKNARSDIERLSGELDSLKTILGDTEKLLQGPNRARLETSQAFCDTLQECLSQLGDWENKLVKKLGTGKRTKLKARLGLLDLKWPFESGDVDHIIQIQNKFRDTLSVALNIDQTRLLLDNFERVDNEERRRILEWVSPILYGKHHNTVKEARTAGTCEWLLRHKKFQEWERTSSSVVLWLQGSLSAGAGKTFLTSKVIDHIRSLLERSPNQEGFAFFYCNRNEEERRKPLSVLRSYVRQLSTAASHPREMRKKLRELWHKMTLEGSELGFGACREQLLESVNLYQSTTLVLDALDECDPDSRRELVDTIEFLLSKSEKPLRILISSRPDRDIRSRFLDKPNIEIRAGHNENDIRKFVDEEIVKHEGWADMSPSLRDEIVKALLDRSDGMFQWVYLQIKQILELETEAAVRDRLGKLPADLAAAYDEIYGKIGVRNKHDRALADRAFKWVMCASYPLDSEELLSAVRLGSDPDAFELSSEITESQLLHLCNNLLLLDSQRKIWRFSHLSVVEYFEQNHWDRLQAHCHAAKVCLKILTGSYEEPKTHGPDGLGNNTGGISGGDLSKTPGLFDPHHPLQMYIQHYWIMHVQALEGQEPDPVLANLLKDFLGSFEKSSFQYRQWHHRVFSDKIFTHKLSNSPCRSVGERGNISPTEASVLLACRFSLYTLLSDWWADAEIPLSQTNNNGENLLVLTIRGGSRPICEKLVRRGMQVNMPLRTGRYGSALIAAAFWGQIEIIEFLVREGADINMPAQVGYYGSALIAAAFWGRHEIIKFLVQEGADINMPAQVGNDGSALIAAADRGQIEIIKFLVQEGADINMPAQVGNDGSALIAAAHRGQLEIIEFLVREGADINMPAQVGNYGSALIAAAFWGRHEIIKFLVQEGADINMPAQVGYYGSALIAAAFWGRHEIIKFLVQEGADINMPAQVGNYGSALIAAAFRGEVEIIEFLVRQGADVNMVLQVGRYGSALAAAAAGGETEIVEHLVREGADINMLLQGGKYGSALVAAAYWGEVLCVERLIEAGAEVDLILENRPYRTALQASQMDITQDDIDSGDLSREKVEMLDRNKVMVAELLQHHGAIDED